MANGDPSGPEGSQAWQEIIQKLFEAAKDF